MGIDCSSRGFLKIILRDFFLEVMSSYSTEPEGLEAPKKFSILLTFEIAHSGRFCCYSLSEQTLVVHSNS